MVQRKTAKQPDDLILFNLRLDRATLAEIKQRAEADRRPVSQWVRILIEDALKRKERVIR